MAKMCRSSSGMEAPSRRVTYLLRRYSPEPWYGDAPRCLEFSIAAFSKPGERIDRGAPMTESRWLADIECVGTVLRAASEIGRRGGLRMARLDDSELNIYPEVAAALGYLRPQVFAQAPTPRIRTAQPDVRENLFGGLREGIGALVGILLGIFGVVVIFVAALLVFVILVWLYTLFTITPQQTHIGMSQTSRGTTVAHSRTPRPPRPARRQHVSAIRKINSAHLWDSMNLKRRRSPEAPREVSRGTPSTHGRVFHPPLTKKENGYDPVPTQ
jgi:hypothetical protein